MDQRRDYFSEIRISSLQRHTLLLGLFKTFILLAILWNAAIVLPAHRDLLIVDRAEAARRVASLFPFHITQDMSPEKVAEIHRARKFAKAVTEKRRNMDTAKAWLDYAAELESQSAYQQAIFQVPALGYYVQVVNIQQFFGIVYLAIMIGIISSLENIKRTLLATGEGGKNLERKNIEEISCSTLEEDAYRSVVYGVILNSRDLTRGESKGIKPLTVLAISASLVSVGNAYQFLLSWQETYHQNILNCIVITMTTLMVILLSVFIRVILRNTSRLL